jgi:hypothetical protein
MEELAAQRLEELSGDTHPLACLANRAFEHIAKPSSRPTCFTSTGWPLYVKVELRAMTKSHRMRESAVMISSTIPSAKYSCSGSPLILAKGSTAIEGLSGSGSTRAPSIGVEPGVFSA